jgi:cytochrome c553
MRRRTLTAVLLAVAAVATYSGTVRAAGDPVNGAALATACMGCHGIDGYRNAYPSFRVPKLGGQKPDYIVAALQAYKNKTRPHPTMQAQAASLSDQDMQDIAAFVVSEGEPATGAAVASPAKEKAAVCAACHGEAGISASPTWPNLAGQHLDYLVYSINEYRNKRRQDPVMQGQVLTLTDADVRALAAYYAAQPGLFTTHLKN